MIDLFAEGAQVFAVVAECGILLEDILLLWVVCYYAG